MPKEYPEYSSPDMVQNNWFDKPEKECSICGMDDEPIVIKLVEESYKVNGYCRWCAELHYIRKHLKRHGTRRRAMQPNEWFESIGLLIILAIFMWWFIDQVVFIG